MKKWLRNIGVLLKGLIFKRSRGVEWKRLTKDRYPYLIALFCLVMLGVMVRIVFFIFSADGAQYRKMAEGINPPRQITEAPLRGTIHDREGNPVAITSPFYRLYLDFGAGALAPLREPLPPKGQTAKDSLRRARVLELRREYDEGINRLAQVIDSTYNLAQHGLTRASLKEHWRKGFERKDRHCAVVNLDVSYMQLKNIQATAPFAPIILPRGKVKKSLFSKLLFTESRTKRIYPFGSLAYRTIGQLYSVAGKDGLTDGRSGIEKSYNSHLRGEMGKGVLFYNAGRYERIIIQPAVDGASVYTTIDMNIQSIVERNLREQLGKLEAESGTVVLMEVATGKVVAISNLQRMRSGDYGETTNMAVSDLSEPGSTFKVASMMVALDDGVIHPNDTVDVGNGLWKVGGSTVRDHNAHHGGYGRLSAAQTIVNSSNVGVAKIIYKGYANRPDDYVQKIRDLGFGTDLKLEIDGYARARVRKRSDNPDRWSATTLPWMSYGYETQIPPIYTLAFFNAIANGGRYMRPFFVTEIRRRDAVVATFSPTVIKEQICKPETLREVQEMLRRVVTEGTGKKARSSFVAISGKSGTAQLASGKGGYRDSTGHVRHQVSFCAYFPSEAPKYSCIAVIRKPSSQYSAGGGVMAAPIIRRIAESLLALEAPIPLDSLPTSRSRSAYARHISSGKATTLVSLLSQMGLPVPQITKQMGEYIQVDTAMHVRSYTQTSGRVPTVVGMSAMDACFLLRKMGYVPRLVGQGSVQMQSIPSGSLARAGTVVVLQLGMSE